MILLAGSYERFLFGFEEASLERVFTLPAHQGPVKCVAAGSGLVVSGGTDDQIHIYNSKSNADLGFLTPPGEGAVSAIALHCPSNTAQPTHMISGSADGSVCIWAAKGGWHCLKVMTGHRKEVTALAVHPTGRLALSAARDGTLRLWDLVRGRCSCHNKVAGDVPEAIAFNTSGDLYAVLAGQQVTVHSITGEGGLQHVLPHSRRATCMAWQAPDTLLVATEGGSLAVWKLSASTAPVLELQVHSSRVRGLAVLPGGSLAATAASDGSIKLWDLSTAADCRQPLAEASTGGARLTCLALSMPEAAAAAPAASRKRKSAAAAGAGKSAPHSNDTQLGLGKKKRVSLRSDDVQPGQGKTTRKPHFPASKNPGLAAKSGTNQTHLANARPAVKAGSQAAQPELLDGLPHDGVVDFMTAAGVDTASEQRSHQKQRPAKKARRKR